MLRTWFTLGLLGLGGCASRANRDLDTLADDLGELTQAMGELTTLLGEVSEGVSELAEDPEED